MNVIFKSNQEQNQVYEDNKKKLNNKGQITRQKLDGMGSIVYGDTSICQITYLFKDEKVQANASLLAK